MSITLTKTNTFINLSEISYNELLPRRQGKPKSIAKRSSRILTYTSGGICGLKGKIKANPMTSATIGEFAAVKFKKFGVRHIHLNLLGKGKRKKEIVRAFNEHGLAIDKIAQRSASEKKEAKIKISAFGQGKSYCCGRNDFIGNHYFF